MNEDDGFVYGLEWRDGFVTEFDTWSAAARALIVTRQAPPSFTWGHDFEALYVVRRERNSSEWHAYTPTRADLLSLAVQP